MSGELRTFLEKKYEQYSGKIFIDNDPITIPHRFERKQDIEIAGFLTATIAWGQRKTIIRNADKLMEWMNFAPYDFMINSEENDLEVFKTFVHRTFQGEDCYFFIHRLRNLYKTGRTLEYLFAEGYEKQQSMAEAIKFFREKFFEQPHLLRSEKHVSNPGKNAAAKRLNMFLRWMTRNDPNSVDFGIWNAIPSSALMCPLDVHTASVSRKLGLLKRKQHDWKAVELLTQELRAFDREDPVKYDIALFALGAFEGF
ncbi:MAG: TIGR02757 family protein [Bacteroidales bacterium]|nr:TIGR02757 family protein [Bacteroidales bacterium]MCF8337193.1 TIGR02757 family protein [Bacteroidales bacterium]